MPHYKPHDYNSVSPYLIVSDAAATLRFLEQVFAAVPLRQYPDDKGKLRHAEVRIDDTVVMLADSAPGWPSVPAHVHIYVCRTLIRHIPEPWEPALRPCRSPCKRRTQTSGVECRMQAAPRGGLQRGWQVDADPRW